MKQNSSVMFCAAALGIVFMAFIASDAHAIGSAEVKEVFAEPTREYSSAPLWVWNDMITEEQVVSTLNDFASQNVKQAFVHPRPGLMTPYFSDDWFRLWKVALKEAKRLDMNLWIYDENSYPSGFAGGLVPEAMPESRGRGLVLLESETPPKWSQDMVAVYRMAEGTYENVTGQIRAGEEMAAGRYLAASVKRSKSGPWFGGKWYVDLTYPGVTEKFIEITMEAYRRQFGDEFGKRIPGVFTDEPHLRPCGDFHWTDDLGDVFKKRWGYDLLDHLPSLRQPVGDWKRVRHNYYRVLLDLFIERWVKPYYNYCEKYGLELTGHYWEHRWPNTESAPDNMAMYAWHQRPAIDSLFNDYRETTYAEFGNVRSVKEVASVANQFGRSRTLCEAYGGAGWDLRFEDMKRIGDWLYVLGINTLNEHLSYMTIRGSRKADYPPSFSYHEPWWQNYHVLADYFARLSVALSHGRQVNRILVIEPTTTTWIYRDQRRQAVGEVFQLLVTNLAKAQVEYEIGSEYIIAEHGTVKNKMLTVGKCQYDTVVLSPLTENLNSKTMDLLKKYLASGGLVICCGDAPTLVDGAACDDGIRAARQRTWKKVKPEQLAEVLLGRQKDGFVIRRAKDEQPVLYHHRRILDDGELLFLINKSLDLSTSGTIESVANSVEKWDAETGDISSYHFTTTSDGIKTDFELGPCGSLLLFLANKKQAPVPKPSEKMAVIQPAGELKITRLQPNVLTLDYVDLKIAGKTEKNVYCFKAAEAVFKAHGLDGNPWETSVQFRDEIIRKKFPADSGFEACYNFTIKGGLPKTLNIVIERPDLYSVTCNGKPVSATKGDWWLDRSFGKIDITSAVNPGRNKVTIKAAPLTFWHELAGAYLLGDFGLESAESGFTIVPERPVSLGPWNKQGHPFYAAGFSYKQTFNIEDAANGYYVYLPSWYGSVVRVVVNGEFAGCIGWKPFKRDVTKLITPGTNTIEVEVIGTLKNTLGPHHENPRPGQARPIYFTKAPENGPPPGEQYYVIEYGLFEPFELHAALK